MRAQPLSREGRGRWRVFEGGSVSLKTTPPAQPLPNWSFSEGNNSAAGKGGAGLRVFLRRDRTAQQVGRRSARTDFRPVIGRAARASATSGKIGRGAGAGRPGRAGIAF